MLLGCSIPRDLEFSAEQLKSLEGTSRIELGFPQSIYEREKWFAQLGMAARGIASCSSATVSGAEY